MQYLYPNAKILLFTKPPVIGKCKTRLIPILGKKGAAQLQEKLLYKIISDLTNFSICPFEIWQSEESMYFSSLEFNPSVTLKLQQGNDLGERMSAAIAQTLSEGYPAIIIGSDCEEYTQAYFVTAIASLSQTDVVIGPAYDGGYLLIGMSTFYPQLFENIEWGKANVLEKTREKLAKNKISCTSLQTLHDIDRPEDLQYLEKSSISRT